MVEGPCCWLDGPFAGGRSAKPAYFTLYRDNKLKEVVDWSLKGGEVHR